MKAEESEDVKKLLAATHIYDDFPKPNMRFMDILPIVSDPDLLDIVTNILANRLKDVAFDKIFMLESRGFFFGIPLSKKTGKKCYPCRKKGKLPGELARITYDLEYGQDTIEIQK